MNKKAKIEKKAPPKREVYGYIRRRPRHATSNTEPSMTKQSFTEECNINNIINKFKTTGQLTHLNPNTPQYGYAPVNDFRESMEIVILANKQFNELPADIRRRFGNSAEQFLEFAQNPENRSQMVEMGLLQDIPVQTQEKELKSTTTSTEPTKREPVVEKDSNPPE